MHVRKWREHHCAYASLFSCSFFSAFLAALNHSHSATTVEVLKKAATKKPRVHTAVMWTTRLITNHQVHFVVGKNGTKHHCYIKGSKTKVKSSSLHPATFSAGQHLQWICVMNVQFIVFLTINYKFYNDFFSLNLTIWIYRLIISVMKWRFQWRCRSRLCS